MWKKLLTLLAIAGPLIAQITVNGVVQNEENQFIAGAEIRIEPDKFLSVLRVKSAISNSKGEFSIILDTPPGDYLISAEAHGYQKITRERIRLQIGPYNITIPLMAIPIFAINVTPPTENQIILEKVELSQSITQNDIINIPISKSTDLKSFLGSLPGVFLGPEGKLFSDGSSADQNNYLMENLLRLNHPISHDLKHMNTKEVDSFDRFAGRYSVEFGRGSGGAFNIYPRTGDNRWRHEADDFFPGIEFDERKGLNISGWKPRLAWSGPIVRDKIFFFNSFDGNYQQNIIYELAKGKDSTFSWGFNNLLHLQANLTPANILTSNIMVDYREAPQTGFSPLRPIETTEDARDRIYFGSIKNQHYGPNSGFEIGYGIYKAFVRRVPQGHGILRMSPQGDSGYSPFDVLQIGDRHQVALSDYRSNVEFFGKHRLKSGLDIQRSYYFQDTKRTGYEHYRLDGTLANRTIFGGTGRFDKNLTETAAYIQDEWSPRSWLFLKYGARLDNDNIVAGSAITPRVSLALIPPGLKRLKIAAGFGVVPESAYLRLFSRQLDQYSISTHFERNGQIESGPFLTLFTANHQKLKIPKSRSISGGLEFGLVKTLKADINYLRKRTKNGYIYAPEAEIEVPPSIDTRLYQWAFAFDLKNHQISSYDSVTLGFHKSLPKGSFVKGFYSWSRGRSKSSLDINIDEPIIFSDTIGPLSWDIPHRFQLLGFFTVTAKNSVSFFTDWRKGQPFTFHNEEGHQVGAFNAQRYPPYFIVNIGYERKFRLFKRNWAVRPGVENLLNHSNPTLVNANTGIPGFPIFYGIQPRKYGARIRWLDKN